MEKLKVMLKAKLKAVSVSICSRHYGK